MSHNSALCSTYYSAQISELQHSYITLTNQNCICKFLQKRLDIFDVLKRRRQKLKTHIRNRCLRIIVFWQLIIYVIIYNITRRAIPQHHLNYDAHISIARLIVVVLKKLIYFKTFLPLLSIWSYSMSNLGSIRRSDPTAFMLT